MQTIISRIWPTGFLTILIRLISIIIILNCFGSLKLHASQPAPCEPQNKTIERVNIVIIHNTKFCDKNLHKRCTYINTITNRQNETYLDCCEGYELVDTLDGPKCYSLESECNKCENIASCEEEIGICVCDDGWTGKYCNLPCPQNHFGRNCSQECPKSEKIFRCDHRAGLICLPGYYGENCERICPDDYDYCLYNCPPGYIGSGCIHKCKPGFFGLNCSNECPKLSNESKSIESTCNHITGSYNCFSGYQGEICAENCPEGFYGNCSMTCSCQNEALCNQNDGSCICKPGWNGEQCETSCSDGYYGQDCANQCQKIDLNESMVIFDNCDVVTGEYTCKPGFIGNLCNQCPLGKFGLNCTQNCTCQNKQCHHITGECIVPSFSASPVQLPASSIHNDITPYLNYFPYLIGFTILLFLFAIINVIFIICKQKLESRTKRSSTMRKTYMISDSKVSVKVEKHHYEEISIYEQGDTYDHLEFQKPKNSHHSLYDKLDNSVNFEFENKNFFT